MNGPRGILLGLGPIAIVAGSYWLSFPDAGRPEDDAETAAPRTPATPSPHANSQFNLACRQRAKELAAKLPPEMPTLVRWPFVLAGDVSAARLDRLYRELVLPITRALHTCYFDRRPTEPVTILVFSGERSYQQFAAKLDGRTQPWYSGYYQRRDRRIMVNLATGQGTLSHELTHALAHFDCPELPQWFDEGLASLHEECRISENGLKLLGRSNWRLALLSAPLRAGRLPSIDALMSQREIRGEQEALVYAHARYFCLYLQHRGLLAHFYRKFKGTIADDPTGRTALKDLLHTESLDGFDREFRAWLKALPQR